MCTLVCADNPNNTKRSSVCFYYLNSPPLKVLDIQFLNECIMHKFWNKHWWKNGNLLCLYRSTSQTQNTFETFVDNLGPTSDTLTNEKSFLIVATGDFNVKTTNWYENDTTLQRLKKWCYCIPIWFTTVNHWTNLSTRKLFFVYWFNF